MTIEFGTWVNPETVNPYIETIAAMIANGPDTAVTLTTEEGSEDKERMLFAKAANGSDKTARLREKKTVKGEDGKTSVRMTFTLTTRHKPRRGKSANETPTDETNETPTDEANETPTDEANETPTDEANETPTDETPTDEAVTAPKPRNRR